MPQQTTRGFPCPPKKPAVAVGLPPLVSQGKYSLSSEAVNSLGGEGPVAMQALALALSLFGSRMGIQEDRLQPPLAKRQPAEVPMERPAGSSGPRSRGSSD